jgi:hypothetical protein
MNNYTELEFVEQNKYPTENGEFITTVFVAEIRPNYKAVLWRTENQSTGAFTESVTIDNTSAPILDNVHRVPPNYGDPQPVNPVTSRDTGVNSN